jgi:two-component system sensor histidine kinase YesM
MIRMNFFRKIVILVVVLLTPVMILYSYSHNISVDVVQNEIEDSSLRQLNFFLSQVESRATRLAQLSVTLSNESNTREIIYYHQVENFFDTLMNKREILDKLVLYSSSGEWENNISIFSPVSDTMISTYPTIEYIIPALKESLITRWTFLEKDKKYLEDRFTWYTVEPPTARNDLSSVNLVVEVSFAADNLKTMLDQFMTSRKGNPFFYSPGQVPILNRNGDRETSGELIHYLESTTLSPIAKHEQVTLSGEKYLASYLPSKTLEGWYLIDFVPLEEVLQPINKNRNLFYSVIAVLLILGITLSSVIYRNVQIPIRDLITNVQRLKRGDYSARLKRRPKNEFLFLFTRFNAMAEQIEELFEKVYKEKIRSREATLKQLQAQINPHFFYNCLFYIVSMSRLGENKSVEAMATNLGEYYRYTTRNENQVSSVKEELQLVHNYLTIQSLRQRIEYQVNIPETLMELPIPRLLLQPIVENAIIHGIEPKEGSGKILIYGTETMDSVEITVEDNGVGLSDAQLQDLIDKCSQPLTEEMGCGVWNVHQRLMHRYGGNSGLYFSHTPLGGIKAVLKWKKDGEQHV